MEKILNKIKEWYAAFDAWYQAQNDKVQRLICAIGIVILIAIVIAAFIGTIALFVCNHWIMGLIAIALWLIFFIYNAEHI